MYTLKRSCSPKNDEVQWCSSIVNLHTTHTTNFSPSLLSKLETGQQKHKWEGFQTLTPFLATSYQSSPQLLSFPIQSLKTWKQHRGPNLLTWLTMSLKITRKEIGALHIVGPDLPPPCGFVEGQQQIDSKHLLRMQYPAWLPTSTATYQSASSMS